MKKAKGINKLIVLVMLITVAVMSMGVSSWLIVSELKGFPLWRIPLVDTVITMTGSTTVIYEDDRVLKSIDALNNGNIELFAQYINASHDSLRDLYEVTGNELDTLVDEARKIDGVLGSRMTGAGFGGSTVTIIEEDAIDTFIAEVGKNYTEKTGLVANFYVSDIGDGGHEIKIN